ncbi:enoyl-CoA hydratase [Nocardioides sp. MH1]|uniref:enoyl-CoA hydratase n=1 Tax=Nocardioides sp. MH1 TaxID=3242490 RepID=UPI003520B056
MTDLVLAETAERIATITLNRPEARNAIDGDLLEQLVAAAASAEADDEVDVLVLTGADPAFCAGLDLKAVGSGDPRLFDTRPRPDQAVRDRGPLPRLTKPVIGAINGAAITGGFELALACDFLVASERARFADTHARVGLQPWWGLSVLLPQAVGVRRARELSATGNFLDAQTAQAWGLVNHVVPHDDLLPAARRLAADIVSSDQSAVRRLFDTYADGALLAGGDAWLLEAQVAESWSAGVDPSGFEQRRQAVTDRGRTQAQAASPRD